MLLYLLKGKNPMLIEYDGNKVNIINDDRIGKGLIIFQGSDSKLQLFTMPLCQYYEVLDKTDALENKYGSFTHEALNEIDEYLTNLFVGMWDRPTSGVTRIIPFPLTNTSYNNGTFEDIKKIFFIGIRKTLNSEIEFN